MRHVWGLWVVCLLSYMSCLETGKVEANGASCSKVLGMGTPPKPVYPAQGSAPQVCLSAKSCCTSQMESTLRRKAVSKMKTTIARKLDGRKDSTRSLRADIKGYFQSIVQDGYQLSLQFLSQSHVNLSRAGGPLLATFFTKVKQSIDNENVNLTDVVLHFFRDSFPLIYQYASGRPERLSISYEKCLKDRMVDIQPFGGHPKRIAQSLINVLKPVQVFLESLAYAMRIIEGSKQLSFTTGCDPVLLQMTYCSLCNGHKESLKPCNRYCLDVLDKCLSPTVQLQTYWRVYFDALDSLATSLASPMNAETVISTVYRDLSTAVVQVLAQVSHFKVKAFDLCGQPQFIRRGPSLPVSTPSRPTSSNHVRTKLGAKMESAKSKMTLLNTLFGELPSAICVTDGMAAKGDKKMVGAESCWNGTAKAAYIGPLRTPMPSFQTIPSDLSKIMTLVSEMKETIKLMKRHTYNDDTDGSASGDSNVVDGSGCDSDDADCASGSGDTNTVDRTRGDSNTDDIFITDTATENPTGAPTILQDGGALNAKKSKENVANATTVINCTLLSSLVIFVIVLCMI